ncbi:acetyl esterase/lipase [Sediminihabitans luteus]|uniref:Acetyl esterase/lipase n=1 Tax=Sediminihabitans luteus TaxID=1138585 RepID=A0A2M9CZD6_9CELL|nr:alpha/beta hydrolase [Sediminihabitans luteus]PJJ77301.1 acetyl esterase/lipase [Sediminihabitans luteus]
MPRPSRRPLVLVLAAVTVCAALAACSPGPGSDDGASPAAPSDGGTDDGGTDDGGMDGSATDGTQQSFSYGTAPEQVADLWLPTGTEVGPVPVVVLVHGGYWSAQYDRSLEDALVRDLVGDGYAVWNVEYRGVGATDPASEGGWPGTFEDVAAAVDLLPDALAEAGVERGPTAVVGHSAGGTLALWLASRDTLPDGAPGADPRLVPDVVVSQAGVNDLAAASAAGAGGGAVDALMGGAPDEVTDDRYALADPARRLPTGVPTLVVVGADDTTVPVAQSTGYADAASAAGDDVTLEVVDGEEHFAQLDPASTSWTRTRDWLDARLTGGS